MDTPHFVLLSARSHVGDFCLSVVGNSPAINISTATFAGTPIFRCFVFTLESGTSKSCDLLNHLSSSPTQVVSVYMTP